MKAYKTSPQEKDEIQADEGDAAWLGVNSRLKPDKIPPGMLAYAENYRTRGGDLDPRLGVVKPGWLNVTNPGVDKLIRPVGNQLYGAGVFQDPNTTEWVMTAADGLVFAHRPGNQRYAVPLPAGVLVLARCTFIQAFGQVYLFRGRYLQPLVMNDLDDGFMDLVPRWSATTVYNALVQVTAQAAQELAYGPFLGTTSVTASGTLVTVVTVVAHGYVTGADITVTGATPAAYNGRFNILVVDDHTFTYTVPTNGFQAQPTGTIKVSNMSLYWSALGSQVTLTSLTSAALVATGTTAAAHGFTTGQYVTIAGAAQAPYNGVWLMTVTGANTFTFNLTTTTTSPATGTITATTSVVLAGQSPDTNPEAWSQIYDILPNADDALYINNRLLVPTAYTPGDTGYDASSSYTKKDYIVATDVLDPLHFAFTDEFRINEGSDDEIVSLVKYSADQVVVLKGKSWGMLSNIRIDITQCQFDMSTTAYGSCAPRAALVAGSNCLFPVQKRGIVGLLQNQQGQVRSTDTPFSQDAAAEIGRINWNAAAAIRMEWWDDKLYIAVPIDGSAVNNAIMVYDFRVGASGSAFTYDYQSGRWQGLDTGPAMCVLEFFKAHYLGLERLFFLGSDGYISMMEEATAGDQIAGPEVAVPLLRSGRGGRPTFTAAPGAPQGLQWTPIVTQGWTRMFRFGKDAPKSFKRLEMILQVWGANVTITANTGAAFQQMAVRKNLSWSRTKYFKPFNKAPWNASNINGDFGTAGRQDYSLLMPASGIYCNGFALNALQYQEMLLRPSVRTLQQRGIQYRITNNQGRLRIPALSTSASEGQSRDGILI